MPSVEYTKEKGLVQVSSESSSLDLRGELSGHRQAVRTLSTTTEQLSVADSGKELLLGANIRSVLLPAVAGVKTSVKFTAGGQFTVDEVFTFEGFGRKFKLKVVAENGVDNDNGVLVSTDTDGVKTFKLERGAANGGDAATHLHALLKNGANDFSALTGVAVQDVQGDDSFQIDSNTPGDRNGVLIDKDGAALTSAGALATNLTANIIPNQGQDAIADASGLRIRLVAAAIDGDIDVKIPVDVSLAVRDEGSFVGTVKAAAGVFPASGDKVTIESDHDTAGDFIEFLCDGAVAPKWYVSGAVQGVHTDDILTFAAQA